MYPKSTSTPLSPPYFPPLQDSAAFSANHRLATLQHQLHIATGSHTADSTVNAHNWSNLIIPYDPLINFKPNNNNNSLKDVTSPVNENATNNFNINNNNNNRRDAQGKKKNPYSIEELLKKPTKKIKPALVNCEGVQQPYGVFMSNASDEQDRFKDSNQDDSGDDPEKEIKIEVD